MDLEGRTRGAKMSGKGKRRSARLLKLEEQKNDDTTDTVSLLDPWQIIRNSIAGARGKRKRNEEIQQLQGEASSIQAFDATTSCSNLLGKSSATQIIEYILDTLEMRDTHELFAMPDDIQVSDYAELVNRPSDFATLRQKNKDGMYKTLEQFENDVYMVFQKAMSINNQDTIPYREAMSLLHQAKQVFLSLKSNRMYSESELSAWCQRHLVGRTTSPTKQPTTTNGECSNGVTPATPQRSNGPGRKKSAARAAGVSADKSKPRQRGARTGSGMPGRRGRKALAAGTAEFGGAGVEQRRLAYAGVADQGWRTVALVPQDRHTTLLYQPPVQGHTYQDSLRRFVRHAGLKARVAAEFRSLELEVRARPQSQAPAYWTAFAPGAGAGAGRFLPHGYCPPPSPPSTAIVRAFRTPPSPPLQQQQQGGRAIAVADAGDHAPPQCELETDEVLKLLVLVGKPAFLERARQMLGDKREEKSSREGGHEVQMIRAGDDDGKVGGAAAAQAGQKSGAGEPPAGAFGPFAPPRLVPSRLGFGQFASSSAQPFKVKPSKPTAPETPEKNKTRA